jgi:hypothetical protein
VPLAQLGEQPLSDHETRRRRWCISHQRTALCAGSAGVDEAAFTGGDDKVRRRLAMFPMGALVRITCIGVVPAAALKAPCVDGHPAIASGPSPKEDADAGEPYRNVNARLAMGSQDATKGHADRCKRRARCADLWCYHY